MTTAVPEPVRRVDPSRLEAWIRSRRWVGDSALAALVALPVLASSASVLRGSGVAGGWRVEAIVAVVVLHVALIGRRTWPVGSFGCVALAELALAVAPTIDATSGTRRVAYPPILLPSSVVFALSLYALAAYGRRPAPGIGVIVGLVGAVLAWSRLLQSDAEYEDALLNGPWASGFALAGLLAAVAGAWGLGMFRRLHASYVAALEERAAHAESEREEQIRAAARAERIRIAREMHDIVAHSLAVIVRQADAGRYAARADPAVADRVLDVVAATGRAALVDMRSLLGVLRTEAPSAADPQPTSADVKELLDKLRASGLSVELASEGEPVPLDRAGELAVYRLVQEALTNVVKHAGREAAAEVCFDWDATGLTVSVLDNGSPAPGAAVATGGQGLIGMRERMELAGGTLAAGPRPDGGFAVRGRLPRHDPLSPGSAP